jgi:hypothetical protein
MIEGRTNTSGGPHGPAGRVFETPGLDLGFSDKKNKHILLLLESDNNEVSRYSQKAFPFVGRICKGRLHIRTVLHKSTTTLLRIFSLDHLARHVSSNHGFFCL